MRVLMMLFAEIQDESSYRYGYAMASGNTRVAKITNTKNIMLNGGVKLEPEFKTYIGDVLAEEEFAASQPGKPVVRRSQEAEMDKLWRSNHWVSSCHVNYPYACTDSFFVGRYRGFADTWHGKYGLHYDAVLR